MMKNLLKNTLLATLLTVSATAFAQNTTQNTINRKELLDKTWNFVAMKCPDKVSANSDGIYVHYLSSLKMNASNMNNINYGTYEKIYMDARDNRLEKGTYSITTDEVGNVVLTLKKARTGTTAKYIVPFVEANHLTLIRIDDVDKCNISYAVAP
ncbi:MAG: hypothetical protein EBZ77_04705 [Chitinophagia bacterium]|nr:hypothetical protein [Chitinophagia bacterium]